ncbi:hypothetical protein HJFPF1_04756 [Paramyrothecium foliicola]|nr:hypothetical protein HJFPF1_04756 [Paramyrothecium foliicola]
MSGDFPNKILAPLDATELQNQGLVARANNSGTQLIHKRRLNRSSDEENKEIPLNIPIESQAATHAFIEIPDHLISFQTLKYVGFREKGIPRRETDPDDGGLQMTFIDFVTGPFDMGIDTWSDNDAEWTDCMRTYGLSNELQAAILDPFFKYLRLSNSCAFWSKDAVEMRYAGLQEIQAASFEREKGLRRAAARPGTSSGSSLGPPHGGSRSVLGLQRGSSSSISIDTVTSERAVAARNAPGYTILYKGLDQARIQGLLDEDGKLKNIETLQSAPPSDFSGKHMMFYFTADFMVAQYYAAYAKRKATAESVVIVTVAIPNAAIEAMNEPEIQRIHWPSAEWKELVWLSRSGKLLKGSLRKYRAATLIIGTISRNPNQIFSRMASWEQVSETHVLKVEGVNGRTPAVQFVFSAEEEGETFLTTHIADRIKISPFTRAEVDVWISQNRNAFPWLTPAAE